MLCKLDIFGQGKDTTSLRVLAALGPVKKETEAF